MYLIYENFMFYNYLVIIIFFYILDSGFHILTHFLYIGDIYVLY